MNKIQNLVRGIQTDMKCGKCRQGFMRPKTPISIKPDQKYPHNCTNCGRSENYAVQYPHIRYLD